MSGVNIYTILITIAFCLLGYVASYIKTKSSLLQKAEDYINKAEDEYKDATKAGGEKFEAVVSWLTEMVPAPLKIFITREMISKMVQTAFDGMAKFANQQLDKVVDHIVNKDDNKQDNSQDEKSDDHGAPDA